MFSSPHKKKLALWPICMLKQKFHRISGKRWMTRVLAQASLFRPISNSLSCE